MRNSNSKHSIKKIIDLFKNTTAPKNLMVIVQNLFISYVTSTGCKDCSSSMINNISGTMR